jgi:hypothetical protein
MKTVIKIACWLPVVGFFAEYGYVATYSENYLSDGDAPLRYHVSIIWHTATTIALLTWVIVTLRS